VIRDRTFALTSTAAVFFFAGFYAIALPLPLWLEQLGIGGAEMGLIVGTFGIASLVLRPIVGATIDRITERPIAMLGGAALTAGILGQALASGWSSWVIIRVLQAAGYVAFSTATTAIVARGASEGRYARLALFGSGANIALMLAPLVTAPISAAFGMPGVVAVASGFSVAATFVIGGVVASPRARRAPTRPVLGNDLLRPLALAILFGITWGVVFQFLSLLAEHRDIGPVTALFGVYGLGIIATRAAPVALARAVSDGLSEWLLPCGFALLSLGSLLLGAAPTAWAVPAILLVAVGSGIVQRQPPAFHGRAVATFYFGFDFGIGAGAWLAGPALVVLGASGLFVASGLVSAFAVALLVARDQHTAAIPWGH
jgi:MFS family permease